MYLKDATTFSPTTFNRMTLSLTIRNATLIVTPLSSSCHWIQSCDTNAECPHQFVIGRKSAVMLSVVMPSVVAPSEEGVT